MYTNNRVQILHLCYIYIPWINQGDGLIYHHNNNFNQFEKKNMHSKRYDHLSH